jgi:hypothetical protein
VKLKGGYVAKKEGEPEHEEERAKCFMARTTTIDALSSINHKNHWLNKWRDAPFREVKEMRSFPIKRKFSAKVKMMVLASLVMVKNHSRSEM